MVAGGVMGVAPIKAEPGKGLTIGKGMEALSVSN